METFTAKQARELAFKSHEAEYLSIRSKIEESAMIGRMSVAVTDTIHPSIIYILSEDGYNVIAKRAPNLASGYVFDISW